jgi:hypothetical protein
MSAQKAGDRMKAGSLPSKLKPASSEVMAAANSSAPGTSIRRSVVTSGVAAWRVRITSTTTPIGTLIRNTSRQDHCCTTKPPTFGPMIPPSGKMLLNRPIMRSRLTGNSRATMPAAEGRKPPPPSAWSTRQPMST